MARDRPSTLVVFSGGSSGCRTQTTLVAGGGLGGQNRALSGGGSCEHIATLTPNGLSADMSSHGIPIPLRNNSAASGSSRGSDVSAGAGSGRKNGSTSAKATKTKESVKSNLKSNKSESKHCNNISPDNRVGRPPSPSSCCLLGNGVRRAGTPTPPMARDKDKSNCGEAVEEIHIVIEAHAVQPSNGYNLTKSLDLNPL